jgi:hypothetical protein
VLKLAGIFPSNDLECIVEVDGYVPINFRTQTRPLGGARYLRYGNFVDSLLEISVPSNTHVVRRVTLVAIKEQSDALLSGPEDVVSPALPILALPSDRSFDQRLQVQRLDFNSDLSLRISGTLAEIKIDGAEAFDRCIDHKGVQFPFLRSVLVGIRLGNLTAQHIQLLPKLKQRS